MKILVLPGDGIGQEITKATMTERFPFVVSSPPASCRHRAVVTATSFMRRFVSD